MKALLLLLPVVLLALRSPVQETVAADGPYICPPCGASCHADLYTAPGNCGGCGMTLVPRSSVPLVAVLLYPGVDLLTSTLPMGVLASSDAAIVYTVADTTDPIRSGDTLEMTPQYSVAEAPLPDVLIVPSMWGAQDDPLVLEWVARAAGEADHVLSIGLGSMLVAKAGLIDGARMPMWGRLIARVAEHLEGVDGVELVDEPSARQGKFRLARDAAAALEETLLLVGEIGGEERRARTAEELGFARAKAQPASTGGGGR